MKAKAEAEAEIEEIFTSPPPAHAPAPPSPHGVAQGVAQGESKGAEKRFNVLVDLCGVFKRSTVRQVRDVLLGHLGASSTFDYLYHVDQVWPWPRCAGVTCEIKLICFCFVA